MVTEFYERKRRLAYIIAVASIVLLAAGFFFGFSLENFRAPHAAAGSWGVTILHRAAPPEGDAVTRVLNLDPSLTPLGKYRFSGETPAFLSEGEEVTAFFGNRFSVLRNGETLRGGKLDQEWPVLEAVRGADRPAWIFGRSGGRLVARRFPDGPPGEITVAETDKLERVEASMDGTVGPLVAWRESGETTVKAALYDGREFVPRGTFEFGAKAPWDVLLDGERALAFTYRREDRTRFHVGIRAWCCTECGLAPPPEVLEFYDTMFVLGRKVTGLAVASDGEHLFLTLTRPHVVQAVKVPLATLRPPSDASLVELEANPPWRRLVASMWPILLLFCSFSLIFLGFTLLRERGRRALEILNVAPTGGIVPAGLLQRAMAWILDLILLLPFLKVAVEFFNVSPENDVDLSDPRIRAMMAIWFIMHFAYHFILEWATGRTLGKKIIGIRVTEANGARLSLRGALVRNLIRPLDADVHLGFMAGALMMFLTRRRQRFGDLIGRTVVVEERPPQKADPRTQQAEDVTPSP